MANASPFILLDDQVVTATVSFVDDEGNPATAPAGVTPAWSVADPDGTLSLASSADGSSCVIKATGKLTVTQAAQVTVTAGHSQRHRADPGKRQRRRVDSNRPRHPGASIAGR